MSAARAGQERLRRAVDEATRGAGAGPPHAQGITKVEVDDEGFGNQRGHPARGQQGQQLPGTAPGLGDPVGQLSAAQAHALGAKLGNWLPRQSTAAERTAVPLPAMKHRAGLLALVRSQQVTLVSGETGSGKTTQIPQFLLDEPDIVPPSKLIVVTQPRRLAAVSIAEHVAAERGELVGDTVGYQIRFDNQTTENTRLVYCTTAILLRRLHCDPLLSRIAVLIVDEVHERDLITEFLLLVVRARLRAMGGLRVILMSATLSGMSFAGFFHPEPQAFRIEGRTFWVREAYLEEALEWTGCALTGAEHVSTSAMEAMQGRVPGNVSTATLRSLCAWRGKEVPTHLIAAVVCTIDAAAEPIDDRTGAILVFLPGINDIQKVYTLLLPRSELMLVPLHSLLAPEQQSRAFAMPPPGRRKVILSTDIAETSVTINDVDFVVNSGMAKERVHDPFTGLGDLEVVPNTKANVEQRRGRAGRVREGACIHLFPRFAMQRMEKHMVPEILSRPLEEVVLQVVALRLGEPQPLLAAALSPPPQEAVEEAVSLLRSMGALEPHTGGSCTTTLTPLGRFLAQLPLHPMSAKMLLAGAKLRVLRHVAAVVALLNLRTPFVERVDERSSRGPPTKWVPQPQQVALARGSLSDHVVLAAALLGWEDACARGGEPAGEAFADSYGLSTDVLNVAVKLMDSLVAAMVEKGGVETEDYCGRSTWELNTEGLALFKLAICIGFTPQFVHLCDGSRTDRGEETVFHASSVNCSFNVAEDQEHHEGSRQGWAVYSNAMRLTKVNLMDTTMVNTCYLLLGAQSALVRPDDTGDRGEIQVWLDGWTAQVHPAVVAEASHLRVEIQSALNNGISGSGSRAAAPMPVDTTDTIADFLLRGCDAPKARGWRVPRTPQRDRCSMCIRGLPPNTVHLDLEALFAPFGRVVDVRIPQQDKPDEGGTQVAGSIAWVRMNSREAAVQASTRPPRDLHGKNINVTLAKRPRRNFLRGAAPPRIAVDLLEEPTLRHMFLPPERKKRRRPPLELKSTCQVAAAVAARRAYALRIADAKRVASFASTAPTIASSSSSKRSFVAMGSAAKRARQGDSYGSVSSDFQVKTELAGAAVWAQLPPMADDRHGVGQPAVKKQEDLFDDEDSIGGVRQVLVKGSAAERALREQIWKDAGLIKPEPDPLHSGIIDALRLHRAKSEFSQASQASAADVDHEPPGQVVEDEDHELPGHWLKMLDSKADDFELGKAEHSPPDDCDPDQPLPGDVVEASVDQGSMDPAAASALSELRARLGEARARERRAFAADDFKSARAAWRSARAAIAALRVLQKQGSYDVAADRLREAKQQAIQDEEYMAAAGLQNTLAILASCTDYSACGSHGSPKQEHPAPDAKLGDESSVDKSA